MSGHQYINNSSNLFVDDDEVDDETFLQNSRPKNNYASSGNSRLNSSLTGLERQRQEMLQRQREIEQRTLDSSVRSVSLLRDSEHIGIETAQELLRQREQLENTNKKLDEINTNLRFSQKHLNGIKSVFSGLKNYLAGKNEQPIRNSSETNSPIRSIGENMSINHDSVGNGTGENLFDNHPSTRLRGLDSASQQTSGSESARINKLLDANLDEMVDTIERLKGLGMRLGEEIDSQNDLIDNIQDKAEVADITINKQNKQMNKLLGK